MAIIHNNLFVQSAQVELMKRISEEEQNNNLTSMLLDEDGAKELAGSVDTLKEPGMCEIIADLQFSGILLVNHLLYSRCFICLICIPV